MNPVDELNLVIGFLHKISFSKIICDAGFGVYQNTELKRTFGNDKVYVMQHSDVGSASNKDVLKYNPKLQAGGYVSDRTKIMTIIMKCIEHRYVQLFDYDSFSEFQDDFLSIQTEYNERTNKIKYVHSKPDDCFHSLLYAYTAALLATGKQFPII